MNILFFLTPKENVSHVEEDDTFRQAPVSYTHLMAVIPLDLATHYDIINNYVPRIPMIFSDFHFSKIEIFSDFLYGYINIPDILMAPPCLIRFIYCLLYTSRCV